MATVKPKGIKVKLDKQRTLFYTLNTLIDLEEALGFPISELTSRKLDFKGVRSFLYYGLIHEDDSLTEKEVGELVTMENMDDVQSKMLEAFEKQNPKNS